MTGARPAGAVARRARPRLAAERDPVEALGTARSLRMRYARDVAGR
jgi:hypothetical protein